MRIEIILVFSPKCVYTEICLEIISSDTWTMLCTSSSFPFHTEIREGLKSCINFFPVYLSTAARAIEVLNFTPLNNKSIRIMHSHRDPSIRKSGTANIFIKVIAHPGPFFISSLCLLNSYVCSCVLCTSLLACYPELDLSYRFTIMVTIVFFIAT